MRKTKTIFYKPKLLHAWLIYKRYISMSLPLYSYDDDDGGDYEDKNTPSCYTSCNHRKDTCLWKKVDSKYSIGSLLTSQLLFITTATIPNNILPFSFFGNGAGVKSRDFIAVVAIAPTLSVVSVPSRGFVPMDGDVVVLALVIESKIMYFLDKSCLRFQQTR